jgi:hypothetical protein
MAGEGKRRGERRRASRGGHRTRRAQRRWVLAGGVVTMVLALLGYFAYRAVAEFPGVSMPDLGNKHIQTPDEPHAPYNSEPPTSGPHLPYIAPWGVHSEPILKELQVHNLEDGGVLVQYNCPSGCADLVARLRAIVERYPGRVILAPYPGMKSRIALTAWTRIDAFDDLDESRITRFIAAYRGIDHHKGTE